MNENDNGGNMEVRVSADPKIVKMFRRLERFLDGEELTGRRVIDFQNVETGRTFATFVSPELWEELRKTLQDATEELESANEMIALLEDDNALLALIDAQNEVLMGRCEPYQERGKAEAEYYGASPTLEEALRWSRTGNDVAEGPEPGWPTDGVCGDDKCSCHTTEASSPDHFADTTIKEHFNVEKVTVTLEEYDELLNLRKKRARDKNTIYQLECKFNAMKKGAATLQAQRDEYAGRLGIALDDLADADGVTRWIRS